MARLQTPIWVVLRRRADELKLDFGELAYRADVGRQTIEDMMNSDDELYTVWSVVELKRVFDALGLSFVELFGMKCLCCGRGGKRWRELAALPRSEIITRRREEIGLSKEELLMKLGYTQWFAEYGGPEYGHQEWALGIMNKYRAMEDSPESIDRLWLDTVKRIAKGIGVPVELLLGVRCARCSAEASGG